MRKSGNEETEQSEQERAECVQESGTRVTVEQSSHTTVAYSRHGRRSAVYKKEKVCRDVFLQPIDMRAPFFSHNFVKYCNFT